MAPEPASPSVHRKLRSRRVRSWLILVLVVPLLALAALVVLAGSPAGNRWLLRQGVEAADLFLPGAELEVGELDTDVLRHIQVRQLRLLADDGAPLITVAGVELVWKPLALLKGEVRVDRLVITQPRVIIGVDSEGHVDLLEALGLGGDDAPDSGPWEGSPVSVRLARAHVVDGRVDAHIAATEGAGTRWSLENLELATSFELEGKELSLDHLVMAATAGHRIGEGELSTLPVGLGGGLRLVDRDDTPSLQDLLVEDLRLQLGSAVAGAEGRVEAVGGQPSLALELAVRDLFPTELTFLTGDLGIAGPFALEAALAGSTEALELQATLHCPQDAGVLRLGLGANLAQDEPTWRVRARLDAIEPHLFVSALPEPFLLHGGLLAEGEGTSWPDGLEAELGLALEPGLAWGVEILGLSVRARASNGILWFDQVAFASALGRGDVEGSFDPSASILKAGYRLERVPLSALGSFGVPDLAGMAKATGRATLRLEDSGPDVTLDGQVEVAGAGYGGLVAAGSLASPFALHYAGSALGAEGIVDARRVGSHGAVVGSAQGPWRFTKEPDGAMSWQADVQAAGIAYGVVKVGGARAAVEGGIPAGGELELGLGFDATDLSAPSSVTPELRADRAVGKLELLGDRLALKAQAKDGERSVLQAELAMDLGTGVIEVPALVVAPTLETTWFAVEPVRATLVEGGLRDMRLQLRSGDALLWGLGDFDPSGPVDLRLMVSDFTLDPLVPIFPGLPRGLQGTTRLALQITGTTDALALAGSAEIEDLVLPGSLRDLDARLVLDGDGRTLGFQLEIPEPGETWASASMFFASGRLPVAVTARGVSLDQLAPWDVDLLLAPGELERFGQRLELDPLQPARLSAHATLGGTPADSTVTMTGAAELPLGEEAQRVRVELDLGQADGELDLELVVSQHMLRQAELTASARTGLPVVIHQQSSALFGVPAAIEGDALALDDLHTWVRELEANLVPLGVTTDVLRRVAPVPEGIEGAVVGGVRVLGDPMRPVISGALQLVNARVGDVGMAPAMVSLAPAQGGYDLGLTMGFDGGGSLLLSGFAPLEIDLEDAAVLEASLEGESLDLTVGGAGIPLGALVALAGNADEVEGLLKVEGRVVGSILDPSSQLALSMDGGSMVLSDLGVRYENIRIDGSVDGKLVQLDELSMRSRPAYVGELRKGIPWGELELGGSAMLDGWVPAAVDLRGEADRFWAIDTSRYRLGFSGDFDATGRWPALEIDGDVVVSDARFVLDDTLFLYSGTLELDPRLRIHRGLAATAVKPEPEPPFYSHMVVDLQLDLARATTVKVEMPFDDTLGALWASALSIAIETRLDGLLDVGFAGGVPSVLGEVEPVWGRADILGSRFALGEGLVSFVGDDPFDPILQLEAVHSAGSYGEVGVDITGSLSEMGLGFRSEDYPDETDIVSILLLGAPMSELSSGQAQSNASLLTVASGVLMGELERQGGGGHLVDMVEIGGGSYKAGRAFGDDIFLTVELEPGAEVEEGENITEVTLDWTISRAWNAEIVTGDQGTSSADLYWTWRF